MRNLEGEKERQDQSLDSSKKEEGKRVDSLAIHPVGHSSVSRDRVSEVLDVESPLESRSEESSEGSEERREGGHHDGVDLEGSVRERREDESELEIQRRRYK